MSAIYMPGDLLLHYEVLGRGRPPVLFLHSWVGSWRYWLLSMEEVALIPQRAYALDLPGYGGSVPFSDQQTRFEPEQAYQAIVHFLDELGVPRLVVVGHGLGALLALELWRHQPERVERLFTVALPWDTDTLRSWIRTTPQALAGQLVSNASTEELQVAQTEIARTAETVYRQALEWSLAFWDGYTATHVSCPWLLVYGEKDLLVPPPGDALPEVFPPAENRHVLVLPETGHFPMLEYPRPFHRLLKSFLAASPETPLHTLHLKEEWQRRVR